MLDLGAGTGKLTEVLHRGGHHVLATEPLARRCWPGSASGCRCPHVVATAEQIPVRSRSVDVVVCGQSFHWFDAERALPEIARVLRPGGVLALAWNTYDTCIPWVRRLKRLLDPARTATASCRRGAAGEPLLRVRRGDAVPLLAAPHRPALDDLARSVSHVATMSEPTGAHAGRGGELYAGYGRGHDGMQLPCVTRCFRAVVRHQDLPPERRPAARATATRRRRGWRAPGPTPADHRPPEDPGMQLIDFR